MLNISNTDCYLLNKSNYVSIMQRFIKSFGLIIFFNKCFVCLVFYPDTVSEVFPVIYMVDGMGGQFPGLVYSTVLSTLASHGYIVAVPWVIIAENGRNTSVEDHLTNIKWVRHTLLHMFNFNLSNILITIY